MRWLSSPLPVPFLAAAGALLWVPAPQADVLTYVDGNKWVAPEHNAPLRALVADVKRGVRQFDARLPAQGRELAVERLVIVRDMLARESRQKGEGILIEEGNGAPAAPNTLVIEPRN